MFCDCQWHFRASCDMLNILDFESIKLCTCSLCCFFSYANKIDLIRNLYRHIIRIGNGGDWQKNMENCSIDKIVCKWAIWEWDEWMWVDAEKRAINMPFFLSLISFSKLIAIFNYGNMLHSRNWWTECVCVCVWWACDCVWHRYWIR